MSAIEEKVKLTKAELGFFHKTSSAFKYFLIICKIKANASLNERHLMNHTINPNDLSQNSNILGKNWFHA